MVLLSCQNKAQQSDGFNNRHIFSLHFGGWKPRIKMLARLLPNEASLHGLQTAAFSLRPHAVSPLCSCIPGISLHDQISSLYKDTSHIG